VLSGKPVRHRHDAVTLISPGCATHEDGKKSVLLARVVFEDVVLEQVQRRQRDGAPLARLFDDCRQASQGGQMGQDDFMGVVEKPERRQWLRA
jgi:hypothetical protein